MKEFSDLLGPYNGVRLMVESDESYKLYVYDCITEQGSSLGVINSENTVLSKLNNGDTVCCPGVAGYSCYKSAIGFDVKGASPCNIPLDHVRDLQCFMLYKKKPKQVSHVCPNCLKLKKRLTELKKSHESMTVEVKTSRASSSSKVPNQYLSPTSKEAKMKSMICKVKNLKEKNQRLLEKINRYDFEEAQAQEISLLVKTINDNDDCRQNGTIDVLCDEAEASGKGRGELLRSIWTIDMNALKEFHTDQEHNSKFFYEFISTWEF